jgi:hypothetical protein
MLSLRVRHIKSTDWMADLLDGSTACKIPTSPRGRLLFAPPVHIQTGGPATDTFKHPIAEIGSLDLTYTL